MADSAGKVSPGSPIRAVPASIWNNMVDAGRAFADRQLSSGGPSPTRARPTDLLKLKNSSGAMRRKGEILKIGGKVIDDITDEHIWLDGVEVTDDCRFGILKEPAESDEVVTAQVSGVCIALVNVTDEEHQFAKPVEDEYVLESDGSGPLEILYAPEGTGELECVVKFSGEVGGTHIVVFSIDSYTAETAAEEGYPGEQGVAICTPRYLTCGGSIPGKDDYDQISVYDPMGCLFNEEEEDLVGRWGYAAWMKPTDEEAERIGEIDYGGKGACRWVALGLCCPDSEAPE
jgi:hypothetical protein